MTRFNEAMGMCINSPLRECWTLQQDHKFDSSIRNIKLTLAMLIAGRDTNFTARNWLDIVKSPNVLLEGEFPNSLDALEPSIDHISKSFLSQEMKESTRK